MFGKSTARFPDARLRGQDVSYLFDHFCVDAGEGRIIKERSRPQNEGDFIGNGRRIVTGLSLFYCAFGCESRVARRGRGDCAHDAGDKIKTSDGIDAVFSLPQPGLVVYFDFVCWALNRVRKGNRAISRVSWSFGLTAASASYNSVSMAILASTRKPTM